MLLFYSNRPVSQAGGVAGLFRDEQSYQKGSSGGRGPGYGVPGLWLLGSPEPVSTLDLELEGPAVGAEVRAMCGRLQVASGLNLLMA